MRKIRYRTLPTPQIQIISTNCSCSPKPSAIVAASASYLYSFHILVTGKTTMTSLLLWDFILLSDKKKNIDGDGLFLFMLRLRKLEPIPATLSMCLPFNYLFLMAWLLSPIIWTWGWRGRLPWEPEALRLSKIHRWKTCCTHFIVGKDGGARA